MWRLSCVFPVVFIFNLPMCIDFRTCQSDKAMSVEKCTVADFAFSGKLSCAAKTFPFQLRTWIIPHGMDKIYAWRGHAMRKSSVASPNARKNFFALFRARPRFFRNMRRRMYTRTGNIDCTNSQCFTPRKSLRIYLAYSKHFIASFFALPVYVCQRTYTSNLIDRAPK